MGYLTLHPEHAPAALADRIADLTGANAHPIKLMRPAQAPLSGLALLGREMFNDPSLSASGKQSCASCHSADHSYGPPDGRSVRLGGPNLISEGLRPPPSLAYLYRQLPFGIGPESAENDTPASLSQLAAQGAATLRAAKTAGASAAAAAAIVPQGGLFWDGREDTLMAQASGPMLNPAEMANKDQAEIVGKLLHARYRDRFGALFGPAIYGNPDMLFAEAMSALSRFQIEDVSFHRFDSKYDRWLEGKARLSPAELRGLKLFNDPAKANCAGCHLSAPGADGLPPLFTDTEYEALGVPRDQHLAANRDPNFHDMGLCGPLRTDLARQTQYCGMFLTPTLRNSARRGVYFHNGVYHTLREVLDFYNLRNVAPGRIYPRDASGKIAIFNDLPAAYRKNVDFADAPFDRKAGAPPPLSDRDIADIIAFIHTLDDGTR
ncbi:MAG: hypothetical protein JOY99_11355 [Sphingomonadaceae bacterium]|nr:hypothetical protein [Sphingomonadaceae bacterium]